jgi:hypothetical protein
MAIRMGIEIHFKRQAAVSPAATHVQNPKESERLWKNAMMVWTRKTRATSEPLTARTKERP